jgi:hypothetical protein
MKKEKLFHKLHCAIEQKRPLEVIDGMSESTKDTACALIEYSLCGRTLMPATLIDHLREFVTAWDIQDFDASASGVALTETVRPYLTTDLVRGRGALKDLLLEDKDLQRFIAGVVRMNKSGRNYIKREPSNAIKGIAILDSVSENVDCMFVHLRENVALTRNRKRSRNLVSPLINKPMDGRLDSTYLMRSYMTND